MFPLFLNLVLACSLCLYCIPCSYMLPLSPNPVPTYSLSSLCLYTLFLFAPSVYKSCSYMLPLSLNLHISSFLFHSPPTWPANTTP